MKTPPLLLGAALVFWGWQSDLLVAGVIMGLILEAPRFITVRWELTEPDFRRAAMFCTVLSLALAIYAISENDEGGGVANLFHGHNLEGTTINSATAWLRWLPIILFLFVMAQSYSTREAVPLTMFSMYWRWRERQEKKNGRELAVPFVNATYPYFIVCLFSSSIHRNEGGFSFYAGLCVLTGWALWPVRSRRYGMVVWGVALVTVWVASFGGQLGLGLAQRDLERNTHWMMRFMRTSTDPRESATAIGQIGEMELSDNIVIRLQTRDGEMPPEYLREASYRVYKPRQATWLAMNPERNPDPIYSETNQTTWLLQPGKINVSSVNIACYLKNRGKDGYPQGLLPLPLGCGELDNLDAFSLTRNYVGDVIADGPGLIMFDALYAFGPSLDNPPDTNRDLDVPTNEIPALKKAINEMNFTGRDERHTLDAVAGFFQQKFRYSLWQGPEKAATTNESSLSRFLIESRSGHCEYFATATVLLLRELKIPARYAVGYYVHEASHNGYVVRERDAHAWCLVWNEKAKFWENFDTTPSSWVGVEAHRPAPLQGMRDFFSWIHFQIAKFRWGQGNLREYILWGLIPVLAALLAQMIFSRRGRKKNERPAIQRPIFWPGLDSEFYALEKALAARGVPRPPNQPLSVWLARALENPALEELREPVNELLRLHYRYRFDPRGLAEDERAVLTRQARDCLEKVARAENAPAKV